MKRIIRMGWIGAIGLMLFALLPALALAQVDPRTLRVAGRGGWLLPVAGNVLCSDEQAHLGRGSVRAWDLCVPYGSPIYPVAAGKVAYSGCNNAGGYGCWLLIDHGGGFLSIMAHMVNGSIRVRSGDTVTQWTQVGAVGWTGKTSFGPHVHLEISQNEQGRLLIENIFPRSAMKHCHLCNVTGPIWTPAGSTARRVAAGGWPAQTGGFQLWGVAVTFIALSAGYAFASKAPRVRHALFHGMALYVSYTTLLLALGPFRAGGLDMLGQEGNLAAGGNVWRVAYAQMRKWEGNSCTHDPVRTFRGVTNAAYNGWRMSKGLTPGDVCRDMTDQQMQAIYYERYWLASGANRLPGAVAVTIFDFAVNAGTGQSAKALSVCGLDAHCINNYREQFYRGAKDCFRYCAGWLNRLSEIRRVTEG